MDRAPSTWKVVLIVEDDPDGRALAELALRSGLRARFDWLPAGGVGNIKRNAEKLISLARDRVERGRGCVAVVVDRDRKNLVKDEPHRSISRACRRAKAECIVAQEALEAWFLADSGICRWLEVSQAARTDTIHDPKQTVARAFDRKTGRPYRKRRARLEVARQSTGVDGSKNSSAEQGLAAVPRHKVAKRRIPGQRSLAWR